MGELNPTSRTVRPVKKKKKEMDLKLRGNKWIMDNWHGFLEPRRTNVRAPGIPR